MSRQNPEGEPSGTQWQRVDDDPTVQQPAPDWADPGPTVPGFEPLPGLLDEVAPGHELTVSRPRRQGLERTVRLPTPPPSVRRRRRPPADDGGTLAVKSGLAGLLVGLAILVPVTGAAVLWSWLR